MRTMLLATLLILAAFPVDAQPRLIGGCEGCEAVLEYREVTDRPLTPTDTLPGFNEAERKLLLRGRIMMPDGETPAEDVVLYVWHTDEQGEYETRGDETGWGRRHGHIRGWIRTGEDGRYAFYTRVPGSYSSNPAHVHPVVLEPNGRYYWLEAWFFEGDPNLDAHHAEGGRGGDGLVSLTEEDGMLVAERDIVLGLNVPGYGDAR